MLRTLTALKREEGTAHISYLHKIQKFLPRSIKPVTKSSLCPWESQARLSLLCDWAKIVSLFKAFIQGYYISEPGCHPRSCINFMFGQRQGRCSCHFEGGKKHFQAVFNHANAPEWKKKLHFSKIACWMPSTHYISWNNFILFSFQFFKEDIIYRYFTILETGLEKLNHMSQMARVSNIEIRT